MAIAKMPAKFIDRPPRSVSELALGEIGHVEFTDVRVGLDLSTYLDKDAKLRVSTFATVDVIRTASGHTIEIANPKLRFVQREITDVAALIPVEEIVVKLAADPFKK